MGMLAANGTAEKVCKACPRGARCKGDAIIANAGFWRQGRDEERLYRCRSGYCNAEEALVAGDDAEPEADAVCRPGHTGVLCFSCVEGYAQQGAYCERCNPSRVRARVPPLDFGRASGTRPSEIGLGPFPCVPLCSGHAL
jgi:hypothetical protein